MKNEDIIEGLKLTKDLWEFDPATGDKVDRYGMSEIDRQTYDAVCGALERLTPKKVTGSALAIVGGYHCPHCKHHLSMLVFFCPHCGQALDWRTKE